MVFAFEKVALHVLSSQSKGGPDHAALMRTLDPRQRKCLELLREYAEVTSKQIGDLFGFQPRTSSALCKAWVEVGFLEIADPSLKARKYRLAKKFEFLLEP